MKYANLYFYGEDQFNAVKSHFTEESLKKMEDAFESSKVSLRLNGNKLTDDNVIFRFQMKRMIEDFIECNCDVKPPKKVKSRNDLIKWLCQRPFANNLFFDVDEDYLMRIDFLN